MTKQRRWRRLVVGAAVAVPVVLVVLAAVVVWRESTYNRTVQRISGALPTTSASRPPPTSDQNWLLIGSDQRGPTTAAKWRPGLARSDAIMLLHLPRAPSRAYVISFARDSWVDIPGHGTSKINAAFSLGGPRLLASTVEQLTGVRIDHAAVIDFTGFKDMTDALGGVEVRLTNPVYDASNGWSWPAGRNQLNGEEALRFVRERKGLPSGVFDRDKRQQAFIKAMAKKAASTGTLTNPFKLDAFLSAATRSLAVDDTVDLDTLRSLALRLTRVGPEGITFVSAPALGTGWEGAESVVYLDEPANRELFDALLTGTLPTYVTRHGLANDVDQVR